MLGRPNERTRLALRQLANTSAEFGAVLDWLQAQREDAVQTLSVSRDQWTAAQMQGVVQTLDALLAHTEDARR